MKKRYAQMEWGVRIFRLPKMKQTSKGMGLMDIHQASISGFLFPQMRYGSRKPGGYRQFSSMYRHEG